MQVSGKDINKISKERINLREAKQIIYPYILYFQASGFVGRIP